MKKIIVLALIAIYLLLITANLYAAEPKLPAEKARELQAIKDQLDEKIANFEKNFQIHLNYCVTFKKELIYTNNFVENCYNNPKLTHEISVLLKGISIKFRTYCEEPLVDAGEIVFPVQNNWNNPEKVLEYLKTPLEES